MDWLTIALIALVVAAVWAVIELALTLKKARSVVDEVGRSANDTIEQLQPIIAKADGLVDDLQPTMKRVDPLVEQVDTTVGLLNESLGKVGGILGDVEQVTDVASGVTSAAANVTSAATNAAVGLVSKVTGRKVGAGDDTAPAAIEGEQAGSEPEQQSKPSGYVVYGGQQASAPKHAAPSSDDVVPDFNAAEAASEGDAAETDAEPEATESAEA